MDRHHQFAQRKDKPASKDKSPAKKKAKRTVNVGSLFEPQHGDRVSAKDCDKNAPHSERKAKAQDPAYRDFTDAIEKYHTGKAFSRAGEIQLVHDELAARLDSRNVDGKVLRVPSVPSDDDIEALVAEERALFKPLSEEVLTIQNRLKNGTTETKEVKLGDSVEAYKKALANAIAQGEQLKQELEDIDEEIEAATRALFDAEEKGEVKRLTIKYHAHLDEFVKEAAAIKDWTFAETGKAKQEDREARADMDRRMEEFMRGLV